MLTCESQLTVTKVTAQNPNPSIISTNLIGEFIIERTDALELPHFRIPSIPRNLSCHAHNSYIV